MPGWTIPDKGVAPTNRQSIPFNEYFNVLLTGIAGVDHVISGCAVTAQGTPDMTVAVAAGVVCSNRGWFDVTAGNVTVTAADGSNPRIDLIVVNSSGTKACRAGTPAANPKPPARTANDVVLASIDVPTSDSDIDADQIDDKRVIRDPDPVFIRADATRTLPNDANENAVFNSPANGRITLPTGTYKISGNVRISSMSATSGNALFDILGAGTATVASWLWSYYGIDVTDPSAAAANLSAHRVTQDTAASMVTATTGTAMAWQFEGTFEVTTAGTLIPSVDQVTAAAAIVSIGSYIKIDRLGDVNAISVGRWD